MALTVVNDEFSDLIDIADEDLTLPSSVSDVGAGIGLEDALDELRLEVDRAVDFIQSDLIPEWEDAEAFYDGASSIPKEKGRSQVTKTVVRDMVRSLKPSVMRVFVQAEEIVEYTAAENLNYQAAMVAMQQTNFVNQLFWRQDGYNVLYNATHNALLKKVGIVKAYYAENYRDEYMVVSNVTPEQLDAMQQMPDVTIVEAEEDENGFFEAEVAFRKAGGKICLEHVPLYEFFVDDSATSVHDARVIGQSRDVSVSDARALGLEYEGDWYDLDGYDVETNQAGGESAIRRGYAKDTDTNARNRDPANHKFLLTEAYMRFDLDGTGISQLYRFWLGGTSHEYIDHERVSENPYGAVQSDPMPDAFFGRSMFDVLMEEQNTGTSLLRATCDNAHAANNVRLAYHETMVNGKDVNATAVGHPIRFRQPGMIQEIGVSSSVGAMLPLLQYLDMENQIKTGSTNAAMGLDPDALQSTDKAAVQNTIQLAQGQVELMCRNMAETGLRTIFDKLLRLSIRHNPREQVIEVNGTHIPVDQYTFAPEMAMKTKVGLGMPDVQTKLAGLQQIAAKQQEIVGAYGMNNPLCNINQLFNTVTDMAALMGIPALGRYFSQITPEVAQQLDQIAAQAAEAARQEKPSEGIIAAETIRAQARVREQELENARLLESQNHTTRIDMIKSIMKDDFDRDKLLQDLALDNAKITETPVDETKVIAAQAAPRPHDMQAATAVEAANRERALQMLSLPPKKKPE